MDRDTIYLDNDDEITSVVDKLKGSDFASIDLVIPKEALVLKSVVNLKLLKKQADSLGKEIVIVTQDKVGKKLATQVGIPVVDKPGEEPKEVRMAEADANPSNAAEAAKIAAAAAATSIATEEAIEFKKNAGKKEEAEESDGIEFKEAATPIEPTAEVVDTAASTSQKETISTPIDEKKGKKKKGITWQFWAVLGGFGALVLFIAAYVFIPMVNIAITETAEKKAVDFTFTADKNYTAVDTTAQTIPAKQITVEATKEGEYPTTGKKDAGTKASGTMTVQDVGNSTSCYSPNSSTTLVAGTRFASSAGLIFVSTSNLTVPGCKVVGGVRTAAGTPVTVGVQAAQPGAQYNLDPTSFTMPALSTSFITAKNTDAFTGGTTKQIQYVTQADVNSAKEDMAKQIETELVSKANEQAGTDVRLLDKAYKITQISATANPDVNGEGAKFTLTVKAKIDALVISEDDLTKLATSVLGDQIGSGKEIVDKSSLTSAAEFVEADFDKGTMKVKVSGEAYVATKLDEQAIKIEIAGLPNDKALEYIKAIDGVTEAQITRQFPSFLKRIPRVKSHIYLKVELDKSGA